MAIEGGDPVKEPWTLIEAGDAPILIVADHASAHVPDGIDLGIHPDLMKTHIALDIGVAEVTAMLCQRLRCSAILGGVSRLVMDFNREEHAPHIMPIASDGHAIPGNYHADLEERLRTYYRPYHAAVAARIASMGSPFILSLHSFTPKLATASEQHRPWEIGILYTRDDRAARIAIPMLEAAGLIVGDQEPYSGVLLNASMNRHAEAGGHPYLAVEMRQDISGTPEGQRKMADILAPVIAKCRESLHGAGQKD